MNKRSVAVATAAVAGFGSFAACTALATPIQFSAGGGTYTYNTDSGGTTATTGDPNAVLSNASFFNEAVTQPGNQGTYFVPSTYSQTGTVSYTFDAAPGETFSTASTTARFNVYYFPANDGYITESITTNVNSTPQFVDGLYSNGGGISSYDTNSLTTLVAGSTSFTLTFSLYAAADGGQPNFYIQLFREDPPQDGGSDLYPFVVTTTSAPEPAPEPATLGLLGFGALAALTRRRRT